MTQDTHIKTVDKLIDGSVVTSKVLWFGHVGDWISERGVDLSRLVWLANLSSYLAGIN